MSTTPAPGELARVQEFINTADVGSGSDELASPEGLQAWLGAHGLADPDERFGLADVQRAIEVREALRALLRVNAGEVRDPVALDTLNRAARTARLLVRFDDEGRAVLYPEATGVEGALGRLLGVVHTAMHEGTWPRLKACGNDTCQWAFYDHSKNRSCRWCTMETCGNTMKARTYRQRRRTAASGAES